MAGWLKTMIGSLCVMTILLHLIPQGKFSKYVQFYAGLLFFLMVSGPILRLFAGEGELERLLQLEFLKEEYYDLETAVDGMAELKNDRIHEAYQKEILRQVSEIARAYGVEASNIRLVFNQEDGYLLEGISFFAAFLEEDGNDSKIEAVRNEIAGVYMLKMKDISITKRRVRQ